MVPSFARVRICACVMYISIGSWHWICRRPHTIHPLPRTHNLSPIHTISRFLSLSLHHTHTHTRHTHLILLFGIANCNSDESQHTTAPILLPLPPMNWRDLPPSPLLGTRVSHCATTLAMRGAARVDRTEYMPEVPRALIRRSSANS